VERWKDSSGKGDIRSITITGDNGTGTLSITTTGTGQAGLTSVENIHVVGSFGGITAKTTNLLGAVTIDGFIIAPRINQREVPQFYAEHLTPHALAADVTMALNPAPEGHAAGLAVLDVAGGLRSDAFDLLVANAPWVPHDESSELAAPAAYAFGGSTGAELPRRFLLEGATLLRAGGVAITLALDVELSDGRRPIRDTVEELGARGFATAVLPTPYNRSRQTLLEKMQLGQPALTAATHVAIVAARPHADGRDRASLLVAAAALRRRWERASV